MKINTLLLSTMIVMTAVLASSCRTVTVTYPTQAKKKVTGPPAHAPAHGYRRKLPSNVEVVFDSDSGVYVVIGLDHYFWLDGHYYRFYKGQWEASVMIGNGWHSIAGKQLPAGLREKKFAKHSPYKHPGRGLALGKKK